MHTKLALFLVQYAPKKFWKRLLLYVSFSLVLLFSGWWIFVPKPPLLEGINFSVSIFDNKDQLMRLSLAADEKYRIYTPLDEISSEFKAATLLYEDRYFYSHWGVNPVSLIRATFTTYFSGGRRMGASTITMQLARLRLGLDTTTIWGKLRQIERAFAYERYYSKDEILEAYLNLAPYGGNIEGIGAAARIYFRKNAGQLNLVECLSLVSVPQNPARRNPLAVQKRNFAGEQDASLDEARERISRLWLEAYPEEQETAFLYEYPLNIHGPSELPFWAPHVTTEALLRFPAENTIKTTIDFRQQKALERMITAMLSRSHDFNIHNASAMLVHWPSMEVRALVGSANFFNVEIEGQVDGTQARRSPGSTLKPFIYALGMDQGLIHPKTVLYDTPRSFRGYDPENADQKFQGPLSATEALRFSRNIPAISLANRLTEPDLYDFLRSAHVNFDFSKEHYGLSLVLGGAELSMRELATLYAMLANRGVWKDLILYRNQAQNQRPQQRLLSQESSVLTMSMIRLIPHNQRIRNASIVRRVPMYWKTGTSNGSRDAWTAGIFGPYVLVVWIGNFNNKENPYFVGATAAAPLFWDIADALYSLEKINDLPMLDTEGLNLTRVKVCSGTGDVNTSLCPDVTETWFIPGVSPIEDSGVYRHILIDKATGLRACVEDPEKTTRVVWEFWPTDLQRVFRTAGIMKPSPPPFIPECGVEDNPGGIPPEIISPKQGLVYHRSVNHPEGTVLTLYASGEADVTDFFWFVGDRFIGRSKPDDHLVWTPPGGVSIIKVIDNFGRGSSRKITVELSE